ncbi:MAG: NHLP family bacteriocin export ABC transporter peptidase/permease/ATPase subunit [Acidobacteriota bacterium]
MLLSRLAERLGAVLRRRGKSPKDGSKAASPRPSKRVRVPTVLQMEAVECGAAALAMILASYKLRVPLEELRVACGVSRDGSKAGNMVKAARAYGMIAKGFRRTPDSLKPMPMPVIIHWNFNHFVVLEGFKGDYAHLNDPAQGPTRVSLEELDTAFTGVALTFEPGPEFKPGGRKRSLWGALAPRLSGSRAALLYVVLAGFGLLIPTMVTPTFTQVFVDDFLVRGLESWLRPLLVLMGATAIVQLALTWLRLRYLLRFETKLSLSTSSQFFWHVLRLPVEFYNQRFAGEIGARVGINDKVAALLSGQLATTLLDFLVIFFYALLMIQYDVLLTVVTVTIAILNLAALRLVSRVRVDLNQRVLKDEGNLGAVAVGGLQTIETLKATGTESDFFSRLSGNLAKVINSGQKLAVATNVLATVPPLLMAINAAVLLGFGGLRVMDGHLSMGMLMAYQALMFIFISPVNRMVNLGSTLQEVEGDLTRLDDVLEAELDQTLVTAQEAEARSLEHAGASSIAAEAKLDGYLELRSVSFGYGRLDPPLIEDFNLRLTPGSRVALVGGSGSGKSTISKLVAGLYGIWDGEILFDGRTRQEIPRAVLNSSVAFVDQDIFLFAGTVRDNLTLWDNSIPERDVLQAARDAAIYDEVASRPKGFASLVEERGANFSGGQRQRLEIARALVGNPAMLVLDEATSALDPTTEKIIDDNLRQRGITCLIVAHRLSTIRDCDEIIVLDHGKVVERGTHEEMMANGKMYSQLISGE